MRELIIFVFFLFVINRVQSLKTLNNTKSKEVDKDEGKSSLAFVFDTTGSMYNDLRQLREGAEMILKTALDESNIIADFVFVPFHDPTIGPVTVTKNKEVFKSALNKVKVRGGGDCPEKSLGGIHLALAVSKPQSFVYVFTDATASDHKLVGKVLDSVQRKQSQVVFVLTGHCNDLNKPTYKVYQQIATASSGQVFNLNKTNVHNVLEFVKSSIRGRSVNLGSAVHPAGYNYTQEIPVDSSLAEVTVSVSGAKPKIKVVNPSGDELMGPPKLITTLDLSEIMIVKVLEPEAGNWTITVGSEKDYSVKVSGLSNLTFDHGFSVEKSNSMDEASYRPLQGTYNHMLIEITPSDAPVEITYAEILTTDGKMMYEVPVKAVEGTKNRYLANAFVPPDDFFYIAINGRDERGQEFRRVGPTAVQAKPPDVPYLTAPAKVEALSHERVVLKCTVESLVPVTAKWSSDSSKLEREISSLQSTAIEYVIEDMSEAHVGTYQCSASNVAGQSKTSTQLSLSVEPPQVTVLPVNTSLTSGEDLIISCSVFSEAMLLMSQIVFTNNNTTNVTNIDVRPSVDGFYTYNKTISRVTEKDQGVYTCVAANRGGKTKQSTYINIESEPSAQIIGPHIITKLVHEDAQVVCQVNNAQHAFWLAPNGTKVKEMQVNGSFTTMLDIHNVTEDGDWSCVALRNSHRVSASDTVQLNIQIKPKVRIEGEKTVTILNGTIYQVVCTVVAKPEPRIVWHRETENFLNSTVVQVEATVYRSVMTLDSDKEQVNGTYFCVGENSLGVHEDAITIRVRTGMQLQENFTDQQVELYSQLDLHCRVDTYPPAKVTWFHNGTEVQIDDNTNVSKDGGTLYVQKVDFHNLGFYSCQMDNGYETMQVNGTLRVVGLESPVLSKEPSRITIRRGQSALITCRLIKGNPDPKITWQYRNGKATEFQGLEHNIVVSDDGYEVNIPNATLGHEGLYRCTAENIIGSDFYETQLIVQYPPELKLLDASERSQVVVAADEKVVLNCSAVGNPPPIVVWTKDGRPVAYSKNLYVKDENRLAIENATVFHSGTYSCNASSGLGFASRTYTVNVYMAPVISPAMSEPLEVLEGQLVELPCAAQGTPSPRVTWLQNGANVTEGRKYMDENGLRFVANLTDFGEYSCIASNIHGHVELNYTLFVWVAPSIEPPPVEKRSVVIGSNVTLQCDAIGFPVPIISWQFNGELLKKNTTYLSFNDVGSLNLTRAQREQEGRYECVAENLAGLASKDIWLSIHEPPTIIPDNYTGPYVATVLDTALAIACKATGKPTPYVVWVKDDYYLDKDSRYDVDVDGTLTIKSPSEELAGEYMCIAKNTAGIANKTATVEIYSVPRTMQSEESQTVVTVVEGSNATVDCPLRVGPADTVKWYKEAVLISNDSLRLLPVSREHAATYACVVSNRAGAAHQAVAVRVHWPPHHRHRQHRQTRQLNALRGTDVHLDCDVDAKPVAKVKWYFNSKLLLGEDKSRLKISGVQLRHVGTYRCVATNDHGSVAMDFTLDVLVPPFISEFDVLDVQLKEGTNATLECIAQGSPEPDIKWTFNNTSWVVQEETLISTNVTIKSEGVFRCDATSKAGTATLVYRVTVVGAAKIQDITAFNGTLGTNVEDKLEIVTGSSIRIACKATGKPMPSIQWLRSGNTISNNAANISYADLIINSVATSDAGLYSCVAINEGGADERKIKLDVLEPPKIFQTLFQDDDAVTGNVIKVDVISGQAFFMHCHPYGNPVPDIYWSKDDMPLKLFDETMVSTDYSEILQSPRAVLEQSGNYTCIAKNKVGETGLVYLVDVLVPPPQPKESTKDISVRVGKQLNLACPVEGSPFPYVKWVKQTYIELSDEMPRIHLTENNVTLAINASIVADSGVYTCVMTNKVGTTEANFNVIIEEPPSIVGNVGNDTVENHVVALRRSVVLKCDVNGHPPPKISWLKDIQQLGEGRAQRVLGGGVLAVWTAEPRDAGQYICVAQNSAGTASKRYNLVVKVPGKWSPWSQWSFCNVTCGLGYQKRSRICHYIDDNNNTIDNTSPSDKLILDESACKGSNIDKRKCHMPSCEEEEGWSSWSRWGACSATCGAGTQARSRRCRARSRTRTLCAGDNVQIRKCQNLPKCEPRWRPASEEYSSQESNETDGYLPEATIEMQPDDVDYRRSMDTEEPYIPRSTKSRDYYHVNVTENLDGSERGPCKAGFRHNIVDDSCEDVDECTVANNRCHATQLCVNAAGGYRCACPRGYRALGAGQRCLDINECEQSIHGCEYACVNVAGGYVCACPRHLRLHIDRHHCVAPPLYKTPLPFNDNPDTDEYLSASFEFPTKYIKNPRYN
ncbi:hemicentin-1-like [Battus philenor]|uniref:hemicentin-1-like n=1 Tax=Battus philenor TaxID=42288 RepID=UPI0035CFBBFB